MYNGTGIFAIVYDGQTWIPKECSRYVPDVRNTNIVRRSKITTAINLRACWNYYNADAKVRRLSSSDITFIRSITGQTVKLYPHIDKPMISYNVIVQKAPIAYEAMGGNWLPYVEFRFEGAENTEILTPTAQTFEILTPTASSIIQRGNDFIITWSSSGVTGLVSIELWKAGSKVLDIVSGMTGESYTWGVASLDVGDDYQIKIIADDYDGLLYDFSAEFGITYGGFVLFDGTDDYVETPLTSITNTGDFTISLEYDGNGVARTTDDRFLGQYDSPEYALSFVIYNDTQPPFGTTPASNRLYINKRIDNSPLKDISAIGNTEIPISGKYTLALTLDYASNNSTVKFFVNGVYDTTVKLGDTLDAPSYTTTELVNIGIGGVKYIGNRRIANMIIYNKVISDADLLKLHNQDYDTMTDKPTDKTVCLAYYKMNDADAGSPWTDNIADSSGNGNHATPVNIDGATFFNPT